MKYVRYYLSSIDCSFVYEFTWEKLYNQITKRKKNVFFSQSFQFNMKIKNKKNFDDDNDGQIKKIP